VDHQVADLDSPISEEIIKKKPTRVHSSGFTSWIRKIRPTSDGMESEVEEPLIIVRSGHRVKESEIRGQCDECGGYDSHLFNCHIYGCKKALCLRHVFFFDLDEKKVPYCLHHYKQVVDEFDTWKEHEKRQRMRGKHER
jgi:Fe-S-cluster containining protein